LHISAILTALASVSLLLRHLQSDASGPQLLGNLLLGVAFSFAVFFVLGLPIALVERELSRRYSRRTLLIGCAAFSFLACALLSVAAYLLAPPQ
jgi:hypothetical protein